MNKIWRRHRGWLTPSLLILPPFGLFCLVIVWSTVQSVWISFHSWDGLGVAQWVGLANYEELFQDPQFFTSLKNNIIWLGMFMLAPPIGFAIALLVNQPLSGMKIVKSLFFIPLVLASVAVGVVFSWVYTPELGLLALIFSAFGATAPALLSDDNFVTIAIVIAALWPQIAFCMVLYLAGLSGLNEDLIGAGRVDGAKSWNMLRYVVLPQLTQVTFIAIAITAIGALRSFDMISVMTGGGPYGSSSTLAYQMYEQTIFSFRFGYGAAIATVLLAIMSIFIGWYLSRIIKTENRGGMMFPLKIPETAKYRRRMYMVLTLGILILWLSPLFAIIMTSIRSMDDLAKGNLWGWPTEFALIENYVGVFEKTSMARYFYNSLMITIPSVIFVLIFATLAGFVLSKYKFRGNMVVFAIFIGGNFLPAQIMMIPVRDLMISLGLYDTFYALIIFHVAFQTGFATLFMRNFIAALPDELFEAAKSEGASPWQILTFVVFPLVRPAVAALAILMFTFIWNDYFWAVILVISDNIKPVTAGLANLRGQYVSAWNVISAATIIVAVPPVILFFLMQKHFIAGLTSGAVKG